MQVSLHKMTDVDLVSNVVYLSHSSELQLSIDSGEASLYISARLAKVLLIL